MAKLLLKSLGIEVSSHVVRVGRVELPRIASWEQIAALRERDEILLNCVDPATEAADEGGSGSCLAHRRLHRRSL